MRADLLLYRLRLAKSRSIAQALVDAGTIRRSGRHISKSSDDVRPGDILSFPHRGTVSVLEILSLPHRRGPATEARACYREIIAETANVSQEASGD